MSRIGMGPLGTSGLFCGRKVAGVAVTVAAVTLTGLGAAPVATSLPDPSCPAAYPVDQLTDGQPVNGLTVSDGTTPEPFSGEVLGVIDDGIAPDLDMIMIRLTSTEVDRVGGIWAGMSGSPVYAEDGSLIGAVSYGLTWGPSPVAGVTPAAGMQELLTSAPVDAAARSALRTAQQQDQVAVPRSMRREIVSSGTAESNEVDGGMSRLPLPLGISGMSTAQRLKYVAKRLDMDGVRVYKAGAVTADAPATSIVAGGNLAASMSYGDLSAVGVGTATAVCGNEVLAFGHPMNFTGPSTLTMHGADAVYIQEDPAGTPFKVANATGPVGGIKKDRLAGLLGRIGDSVTPPATKVTSHVEFGTRERDGLTSISVPSVVPEIAAFHMLVNEDRIFDGVTGGSSLVSWKVSGTSPDGQAFSYTRHDRFADEYDVSFNPVFDLYDELWRLQRHGSGDIKLDTVHEQVTMSRVYRAFTVKKVEARSGGSWVRLRRDRVLRLTPGTTKWLRATLVSQRDNTRYVRLAVQVPRRAEGRFGNLTVQGGNSFNAGNGGSAKTLPELLHQFASAPRNDDVLARLSVFGPQGGTITRADRERAPAVVNGGISVDVRVTATR